MKDGYGSRWIPPSSGGVSSRIAKCSLDPLCRVIIVYSGE
jgi:hypothetical protein